MGIKCGINYVYLLNINTHAMRYFLLICIVYFGITINLQGQDCDYEPVSIMPIDSCNFDGDSCGYLVDLDTSNIWVKGFPQKSFFGDARTFPNAIMTDSINPYPKNNNDFVQLDIPIVDYMFSSNAYVEFWHKFQFDSLKDGGYFNVSFDDSPYFTKEQLEHYDPFQVYCEYVDFCGTFYDYDNLFADSINGFSGTIDEWSYTRILFVFYWPIRMSNIPFKSSLVEVDTIHLRFYILTDSIEGGEAGWIIDDFLLGLANLGGSIDQSELNRQLKTYPNPVSNEVNIFIQGLVKTRINIDVFDINGRRAKSFENIFTDEGGYTKLDLTDIPSGIWVIKIASENENYYSKIIKQ